MRATGADDVTGPSGTIDRCRVQSQCGDSTRGLSRISSVASHSEIAIAIARRFICRAAVWGPPSRESGPMSRPPRHATARGRFFWAGRSVREPLARGSVEAAPTNDPYNRRRIAQFATRVRATLAARRPSASARRDTRNDYARIGVPITRRYLAMYDSDSVAAAKPERHKPQPCRESSIRRISSASVTLATYRQLTATVTTVLRSSPTAPAQTSP